MDEFDVLPFEPILEFAGIPLTEVPCYPIVQQITEKLHALTRPHASGGSTRGKDLADILLLAGLEKMDGQKLRTAVTATFQARATHPFPTELSSLPKSLKKEYEHLVNLMDLPFKKYEAAEKAFLLFLGPVLGNDALGVWDKAKWIWNRP